MSCQLKMEISSRTYFTILRHVPLVTVDIIILSADRKKTLVGLRKNKPARYTWYSIGGRLQKHESFIHCAIRQLQIDLGLKISLSRLKFIGIKSEEFPDSSHGKVSTHNINLFFGLIMNQNSFMANDQHSKIDWLSIHDGRIHPYVRQKIRLTLSCI